MTLIPFTAHLQDGTASRIREVGPDDRRLLEIGFEHLSDQSRYFRFLGAINRLTGEQLDRFCSQNSPDHIAIGALSAGSAAARPLGIARYIRLTDRQDAAEFAVTVIDSHQGVGLGRILLGVLARCAREHHISEFVALVHRQNAAMLRVLRDLDGRPQWREGSETQISVPIHENPEDYPRTKTGDLFRKTYALVDFV